MSRQFDVVVSGAGMVGACAALALARKGFHTALIEPAEIEFDPVDRASPYSERISSISPTSETILGRLDVWSELDHDRVCQYDQMHIWHENGDAAVHFDCVELARESLGSIVENRQILRSLHAACEARPEIDWFQPDSIESLLENSESGVTIRLKSGIEMNAGLLLVADGRHSNTREMAGFTTHGGNYGQTAIVANLDTEAPHRQTAWQRFLSTGPLALLPLANGQTSIVWSCDQALADELIAMSDDEFCDALGRASEFKLGEITGIGKRLSFPLGWHSCEQWLRGRILLIGDAAHSVHPLAGQGVNLGFSDVDLLMRLAGEPGSPWRRAHLRRFERQRKSETAIATHLFSGLKYLYGSDRDPVNRIRNLGMQLVQANPWCKRLLMQQAIRNMA